MVRLISLIVDDEPAIRKYIRAILERESFETVEAGGGTRGLEILRDLSSAVHLIVSDINMADGDGLSFARSAAQSYPGVPIVLVSGFVVANDASPFEFVEKPFSPDSLLRAVRKAVTSRPESPSGRNPETISSRPGE